MHEHLSRELFRAIHKGWRNPGDLAAIAMAHLFELCPHCQHEFETWRGELGEGVARDEGDYDGALQRIREQTAANDLGPEVAAARLERDRHSVTSRAHELLALPPHDRLDWIRTETQRSSGLLLAEALIEECRRKTPGYPHEGLLLANLARVVLHHSPTTLYAFELFLRALAHLGNAERVVGNLPRAEQLLTDARHLLRCQDVGHRLLRAEIDSLDASLRIDQFRYEDGIALLLRALMVRRLEGDGVGSASLLIQLARAHLAKAEYTRSFQVLVEAEHLIGEDRFHFLRRIIRQLRSSAFCRIGEIEPAIHEIESSFQEDYDDPLLTLRGRWLISKIEWRAGNFDAAEQGLVTARRDLAVHGIQYDVVRVDLELAQLYCRQERGREALDLLDKVESEFVRLEVTSGLAEVRAVRDLAASC